ncbi:MAG: fibronectin type III domain-containing protein [Fervidobacterium sp.]
MVKFVKATMFGFMLLFLLSTFHSCVLNTSPRITHIIYDGKDYKDLDFIQIERSKEITVNGTLADGTIYTWKLDEITLVNERNKNKFKFKDHENNEVIKNLLSESFFKSQHNLSIIATSPNGKSVTITKKVTIINLPPSININPNDISPDATKINISIQDPEGDPVVSTSIQILRSSDNSVIWSTTGKDVEIDLAKISLTPDIYTLKINAKDAYGAESFVTRFIRLNASLVNEIVRVKYNSQSMQYMTEPVNVDRTGEFEIVSKDSTNAKYSVEIDGITIFKESNSNVFKLKDYNDKLELSKGFFDVDHKMIIKLYSLQGTSLVLQDLYSKSLKINNLAPRIDFVVDNVHKKLIVEVVDDEGDRIVKVQGKILNSSGKVITMWNETRKEIETSTLKNDYQVTVYAEDEFGSTNQKSELIGSLTIQNNPPQVSIIQPYQGERTPISLTVRWKGKDPDEGDVLKYKVFLKEGPNTVTTLETTSTEAILTNLDFDTNYELIVEAYDLQMATASTTVLFTTVSRLDYSYILSKSFDGKSMVTIANNYSLPTVKIEGYIVNDDNRVFTDFDVAEDYIYAVGGTNLYVINASDKASPKIVKKVDLGTTLTAIKLYKNYAIVGQGSNGICIVDLTDPKNPILTNKNFARKLTTVNLPIKSAITSSTKNKKTQIDITRGTVFSIKLSGTKAYITNGVGGLLKVNLSNIPNITINDITLLYDAQVTTIDIGQFDNMQIIAFSEGKDVKFVKLSDAESSSGILPTASITSLGQFDTDVRGIKIAKNSLYAFSIDRIKKWTSVLSSVDVIFDLGGEFNDVLFVGNSDAIVVDGKRGLITYKNDQPFEPNKIYKAFDSNYINNFVFLVGDGTKCNGLYIIDVRNPLEPTIRQYETGQYLNKIDVKIKAVPKGSTEQVAKIATVNNDGKVAKLYDFDYNTLTLSAATPLDLSAYAKVFDVAIDAQGRAYVLGDKSGDNVVDLFDNNGNYQSISVTLPATIDQNIPHFKIDENVEPKSIQVVVDYLSQNQKPSYILVSAGPAGIVRYTINTDTSGNVTGFTNERQIPTPYYVVEEGQQGFNLKKYNPGNDLAVATDKYFDRIFVADGEFNGIWILDRNGVSLTEVSSDNLTKTPVFEGAPARNISWYADKVFVSGGGFGVKILDATGKLLATLPFNGLTYAFHSVADSRYLVIVSDNGLLLYDISNLPDVKPISALTLPMYKIIGR